MRLPNWVICLLQRGVRRRQAIMQVLAQDPKREWLEWQISQAVGSWAGVVGPDMLTLWQQGKVTRRLGRDSRFYYKIKARGGRVAA